MSKLIYIVRHGETEYNKQGIIQGQRVDTSLNNTGRQQATAFYNHYKSVNFDVVITSALQRTHQTMQHFIEKEAINWIQYPEINEMDWGVHEGKSSSPEMREEYKMITQAWNSGDYDIGVQGGETAAQLGSRLSSFIDQLVLREEEKILICSHGRAMRALICLMKETPLKMMGEYHHSNTGLYKATYQDKQFTFLLENDLSHLSK